MKKIKAGLVAVGFAAALAVSGASSPAHAAGAFSNLYITNIAVSHMNQNIVYIALSADATGKPACASSQLRTFVFDISTNQGKAYLSLAQAAMLAHKRVAGSGTNTCPFTNETSIEALRWFEVRD